MPQEFLLVPKEQMLAIGDLLQELMDLHSTIVSTAGSVAIPWPKLIDGAAVLSEEDAAAEMIRGKYVVRRGGLSYADVVDREVKLNSFTFERAWDLVAPKIISRSKRARESMRRALDGDRRFLAGPGGTYLRRERLPNDQEEDSDLPF